MATSVVDADRAGSNLREMAEAIGMSPKDFFDAVKRQCTCADKATDMDFVALLHTAKKFGLDPLRKEVSLIATKQGPRVYVTFDGWLRVLVSHPLYYDHGWKDEVWSGEQRGKGDLLAVTFWIEKWVPIHAQHAPGPCNCERRMFEHPELLIECREKGDYTPWNKWPSRMLREKAAMQGTRFCFAMYVPDLDDVTQAETLETARVEALPAPPMPAVPIAPAVPIPDAVAMDAAEATEAPAKPKRAAKPRAAAAPVGDAVNERATLPEAPAESPPGDVDDVDPAVAGMFDDII